tara:strand:- start:691 stop:1488 length:798 start_codon:yes stop_codon:yes gene_type:complete
MTNNITVIIPIHKVQKNLDKYLKNALLSVEQQTLEPSEILIVRSKDKKLKTFLDDFDFGGVKDKIRVIENKSKDTSFQNQLNFGANNVESEYFTFLEYDDELSKIWLNSANTYINSFPEVGAFLPIIFESDEKGNFLSFTNENVWVKGVSSEMGFLDNETLVKMQNFNFDGMVIKKTAYQECGGLKTNMKLTFTYEFLLRLTYQDIPVMVIPKLGYKHLNNREGSLFVEYKNTIDVLESKFWVNKAKKEYFFTEDREITYELETV